MPAPGSEFGWPEAFAAFVLITIVAFLVTWVFTDRLHLSREPYIAVLLVASLGLGAAYLGWSGTSVADLVASDWGWSVGAGFIAASVAFPMVRRLPPHPRPAGARLGGLLLWEGVAYGIAEAVLLASLPVLAVWHMAFELGWTAGGLATIGSGMLALAGALLVILVHHLGYEEFRTAGARPKLVGALVVCGLQAVAFLLTGNVLAPVVAHVVLHCQMLLRGVELPPVGARVSRAVGIRDDPRAPSSDPLATAGRS